jgi:hypothetical protein
VARPKFEDHHFSREAILAAAESCFRKLNHPAGMDAKGGRAAGDEQVKDSSCLRE